jgi:Tol biopolymer transport system component
MRWVTGLLCTGLICGAQNTTHAITQPATQSTAKHRILFNRFRVPEFGLFIADADGKNERRLVTAGESDSSPALSLNGQWVAFTSERMGQADIYRVHPDGTALEQLTNDPAFDDQAALSPDGNMLAFMSTRGNGFANIWLLDIATKKYRSLTNGRAGNFRPSWSPDGKWIAFSSDRDSNPGTIPLHWEHMQSTGIYVVRPDGTGLRRITRIGGVAGSPAWSADGKKILYYETDELGAYMAKNNASRIEIVSVDVATGEKTGYTASNETKFAPQFLPDGKISYVVRSGTDTEGLKVFYPDRRVVSVVKGAIRRSTWTADGKQVIYDRILQPASLQRMVPTFSRDPEFALFLNEPFPSFSPDGKKLVYSAQAGNGLNPTNTSIEVMNTDGTGVATLFKKEGYSAFNAVWSPAGDEIALSVGKYFRAPGLPAAPIALMKPDGSDYREIVDDGVNNGFPSWSPDGKRLVYKHGKQLMILTLGDGKKTMLTDGSHYDNFPEWSPKGDVIMFTSDRSSGEFQLFTIHPDGTGVHQLTDTPMVNAHSAWSPDGEWAVFTSGRMGFKDEMALFDGLPQPYGEIFAMRANGSDVRQLTDNKWEEATVAWAPEQKTAGAVAAKR